MSVAVDIELLKNVLTEACFGASCTVQRSKMEQLENFEGAEGFVSALIRIIHVNDLGAGLQMEVRQLASILLKNIVGKYWSEKNGPTVKAVTIEEKMFVKKFLISYVDEPECAIANHLAHVMAKVMRFDWPAEWREVVPALLAGIQEESILRNVRCMVMLDEVLSELKSKADQCSDFKGTFHALCLQLYPTISKVWAANFKTLQGHLQSLNVNVNDYAAGSSQFGTRDRAQEILVYYLIRISSVMNMIVETSYVEISTKYATVFANFWKTYVGVMQVIAGFLRKARPLANVLLEQAVISNPTAARRAPGEVNTAHDESADDTCDYYIPAFLFNEHNGGLFSYLNMLLKLNKALACCPVHLQKQYSLAVVPHLESLLNFYFNHLVVEFGLNAAPSASGEQRKQLLPLCYLTTTAVYFLYHVLSCSAYDAVNLFRATRNQHEAAEGHMEEVEVTTGAAAVAHELRARFFSAEVVAKLMHALLYHTLRYKVEEFREWAEDAENFYLSLVCPSEKCNLRSASECLYTSLLEHNPEVVTKIIFDLLNDHPRQLQLTTLPDTVLPRCGFHPGATPTRIPHEDVLLYESVYLCAGFSATHFNKLGDCTLWTRGICGPVFGNTCRHYLDLAAPKPLTVGANLLLARLTTLLSAYGDNFNSACIYLVCDLNLSLINSPAVDPLTKMFAVASQVSYIASATGFTSDQALTKHERTNGSSGINWNTLRPTLNFTYDGVFENRMINVLVLSVQSCCVLISKLEEGENKLIAMELIKECIQVLRTVQAEIKFEVMLPIAQYLSELWRLTVPRDPTRCKLLELFRDLVLSAGSRSVAFHALCLPLVSYSCTITSNCNGCLVRDGLALWLAVMRNTSALQGEVVYSQGMDDLFYSAMGSFFGERKVGSFSLDGELVRDFMLIVEAYVLVGKKHFFGSARNQVLLQAIFSTVIASTKGNAVQYVTRPLELMLVLSNADLSSGNAAASFLVNSGLLHSMLRVVFATCNCHIMTGVYAAYKADELTNVQYLSVVMRVLLASPAVLLASLSAIRADVIDTLCKMHGVSSIDCTLSESVLIKLLVKCATDNAARLEYLPGGLVKQKLWCLALVSLYPSSVAALAQLSSSPAQNGCIFGALSNFLQGGSRAAPVKAVQDEYVWHGVVTLEHQVEWIQDIVRLAESVVNQVGMPDSSATPRPDPVSVEARVAVKKSILYSKVLRELITTSGDDSMSPEDMGSENDVVPEDEPIFALFAQAMCDFDEAIIGNVAEVVMGKLQWLRTSIGEERYRQLNISC